MFVLRDSVYLCVVMKNFSLQSGNVRSVESYVGWKKSRTNVHIAIMKYIQIHLLTLVKSDTWTARINSPTNNHMHHKKGTELKCAKDVDDAYLSIVSSGWNNAALATFKCCKQFEIATVRTRVLLLLLFFWSNFYWIWTLSLSLSCRMTAELWSGVSKNTEPCRALWFRIEKLQPHR